jgi:DNA-binding NarL/FixJ family response regulator
LPLTVLIVDDHVEIRAVARLVAQSARLEVIGEAASGQAALDAARALRPDLVLLDIRLPGGLDGFEVAERLAVLEPPPAVVLMSSGDMAHRRGDLQRARVLGFIRKERLTARALAALIRQSRPGDPSKPVTAEPSSAL